MSVHDEIVFMAATAQLSKPKPAGPQHPDKPPGWKPQKPLPSLPRPKGAIGWDKNPDYFFARLDAVERAMHDPILEQDLEQDEHSAYFKSMAEAEANGEISRKRYGYEETKIGKAFRAARLAAKVKRDRLAQDTLIDETVKAGRAALRARELKEAAAAAKQPDPAALFEETLKQYKALQAAGRSREANQWYAEHRDILCSPSKQSRT